MNFLNKLKTKANTSLIEKENKVNTSVKSYYAGLAGLGAVAATTVPVMAIGELFNTLSTQLRAVYAQFLGISTVVAVVFITGCLLVRMISKNQRAVEEATSWIKRIALTWCVIELLGLFVSFAGDLTGNGGNRW